MAKKKGKKAKHPAKKKPSKKGLEKSSISQKAAKKKVKKAHVKKKAAKPAKKEGVLFHLFHKQPHRAKKEIAEMSLEEINDELKHIERDIRT